MSKRLQPVEIPTSIEQRLNAFDQYAGDSSLQSVLRDYSSDIEPLAERLNQAVIVWSNSTILKQIIQDPSALQKFAPAPSIEDPTLRFLMQAETLSSSSIVLRTYVSVVLGRFDDLVDRLSAINRQAKLPHLQAAISLLREDEIRYLRNAIGHGTYVARGSVLRYWDGEKARRISFPELDQLNYAVFKIVLAAWSACEIS